MNVNKDLSEKSDLFLTRNTTNPFIRQLRSRPPHFQDSTLKRFFAVRGRERTRKILCLQKVGLLIFYISRFPEQKWWLFKFTIFRLKHRDENMNGHLKLLPSLQKDFFKKMETNQTSIVSISPGIKAPLPPPQLCVLGCIKRWATDRPSWTFSMAVEWW